MISAARSAVPACLLRNPALNRDLPECLRKEAAVSAVTRSPLPVRHLARKHGVNLIAATYRGCGSTRLLSGTSRCIITSDTSGQENKQSIRVETGNIKKKQEENVLDVSLFPTLLFHRSQ